MSDGVCAVMVACGLAAGVWLGFNIGWHVGFSRCERIFKPKEGRR